MRIDCYLSAGCGSEGALRDNLARAVAKEAVEATVQFHRIDDAEAMAMRVSGSPSIFINQKELQPLDAIGFS